MVDTVHSYVYDVGFYLYSFTDDEISYIKEDLQVRKKKMAPNDEFKLNQGDRERLRSKYPGLIPIFVSKAPHSRNTPEIKKKKFLVPMEYTIANVVYVIRKYMDVRPEQGIFLFIGHHLPPSTLTLGQVEQIYADKDGLLRITYALENTFG